MHFNFRLTLLVPFLFYFLVGSVLKTGFTKFAIVSSFVLLVEVKEAFCMCHNHDTHNENFENVHKARCQTNQNIISSCTFH